MSNSGRTESRIQRAAPAALDLCKRARRFYLRGTIADVEPTELEVLVALLIAPAQLVGEIAESLEMPRPTVSNALDRLRRKGLVAATADPDDARASRQSLTDAGEEAVKLVLRHHAPHLLEGEPFWDS
jgi:DNA-binding MarR family transcriptional regulator